jgi:hypothetical protein
MVKEYSITVTKILRAVNGFKLFWGLARLT